MALQNTQEAYGWLARLLHWGMAVAIIAMFGLGLWMVTLDYYSPYYKSAPDLHKSIGIILLGFLGIRFVWRLINIEPETNDLSRLERSAGRAAHLLFYPLLLALMISGYLISTADGRAIDVFGLFSIPSLIQAKGLEDSAGAMHEWLAYATIALAAVHALAALKHHFLDRNRTLVRMWSGAAAPEERPIFKEEHTR